MIHYEPWFSCNQCGRKVDLFPEALKDNVHFCDRNCKDLFYNKLRLKEISDAFVNQDPRQ